MALLAWIDGPLPGQSALHAALRDGALWPNLAQTRQVFRIRAANPNWTEGISREPGVWEAQAEDEARREGVLRVGERHLLAAMSDDELHRMAIRPDALRTRVRELELGILTLTTHDAQCINLVPDTSALIEYRRPDEVKWSEALGETAASVQLWIVGTVLNELDDLKRRDGRRVSERARERGRWLWSLLPTALTANGAQVREDCIVRIWRHQTLTPFRDTDHLEAALELRSLGLPVGILSDDTLMLVRAGTVGLTVRRLEGKWRLDKAVAENS